MAVDPARAKSLFLNASELADPAERAAYLERECGDNAELHGRVEALLRVSDESPLPPDPGETTLGPLSRQPDTQATVVQTPGPDGEPSPISITASYGSTARPNVLIAGRYTLQEKIGEGGMGEVWVAKQSEPVKRRVALKLIKPGMDSRAVLQRFEQERQALAMMDHTNIAKVFDAGMTPNGQPFFAMELVNGLPLNKFCDELKLTPKERLELFVPICQAVQHAHQKGIVHRDLKPANILITMIDGKPVPKVIDFGVAKATAGKLTDESMSTQFGAVVGTLEYMSPEQAGFSGEDIDTRADIYSLGVILYEMLTGLRPLDAARLKKAAMTEMIRIIREDEPSKPSTRLSTDEALPSLAALRQIEPRKLMALLRGDLDWVVMKCLEKHRERRYETANALARDVQRYLDGDAVEACPPSVGYRMGKFLKRNKGPVLAASFVLLALVVGFIGTAWGLFQADRARRDEAAQRKIAVEEKKKAEQREELAIDAVKRFRDAVADNLELKNNPGLEPLRKTLLKEPLAFFKTLRDRLQADKDTRPESLARLALASYDLGTLTNEIGDKQDALIAYRESLAIYQKLADDQPSVTEFQRSLADGQNSLGVLLHATGKTDEALKAYEVALAIQRKLAADQPNVTEFQSPLARTQNNLGNLLHATGKTDEALKAYEAALAIQRKLAADQPNVTKFQSDLAEGQNNLGVLLRDTGKLDEALKAYEAALAIYRKLAADHPTVTEFRSNLTHTQYKIGHLLRDTGNLDEALKAFEVALAIQRKLAADHPSVTEFQSRLAGTHLNIGVLLHDTGKLDEALKAYEAALAILRKLAADHPTVTEFQSPLAFVQSNIGNMLRASGKLDEALKAYEAALAILRKLAADQPNVTIFQSDLAEGQNNLGGCLRDIGKLDEALKAHEGALAIRRKLAGEHPESPDFASNVGGSLSNLSVIDVEAKRFEDARERLREAVEWQRKALTSNPTHPIYRQFLGNHLAGLIMVTRELGGSEGLAEAERELAKLRESDPAMIALDAHLAAMIKGDQQPKHNFERLRLAQRAYEKGVYVTATRFFAEALAADPKLANDRQNRHRYNAACVAALAAGGQGKDDPRPDDAAKAKLRGQAHDWLKAELSDWKQVSMIIEPGNKELVAKTLTHWKQDADFVGIRDDKELGKLSDEEHAAFKQLWNDVDALLTQVAGRK